MSPISSLRKSLRTFATGVVGLVLSLTVSMAQAATTSVEIGFDTDNNPATGCTLTVGSRTMAGVEVALATVVTTTANTGTVGAITRRTCTAGVFGAPVAVSSGGWPVGMTTGLSGSDLIETFIPLADLGVTSAVKIGALTPSDSLIAAEAFSLLPPPATATSIPALSPMGLLILLVLVSGTGWLMRNYRRQGGQLLLMLCVVAGALTTASALAIVLDGNGTDWTGIAPLATGAKGDAPAGQDLVALYAVKDGANLAVRIDMVLEREAVNQAPVVNAGTNQTITLPASATLSGSATDDGLPNPPAALTYAWTKVSGPGSVTFGSATSKASSASFSVAGTYVLRLTANDSALSGSADVTITVNPASAGNQPPVVNAGANQTITLPAAAALAGTATDDGLPNPPAHLTTTWSFVSGPSSGVVFGNPASLNTSATFAAPGTYTLRLTASDSALSASSDMQVTVNDGAPLFLAIPDRTIALGTRYQQLLVASDTNVSDTLTYSLLAAPSGAALSPSPLVDWTPTAAQLGLNTFTAKVTDSASHTAQTTFHVTVVHTNQPPQLAPQANVILPVGTVFTRTLQATDPDAGDVLTFALGTHPTGMTLTGAVLNWPTTGKAPGDYAVTVRVTDAASMFNEKTFTVTLTQAAPAPVAKDDSYTVKVSQVLSVPAAGVLANDIYEGVGTLTATRLTDPGVGAIAAFGADGSFSYQAPATVPGDPLTVAKLWNANHTQSYAGAHELVADLNGDGYPDIISFNLNADIRAWSGHNGSQLWALDRTGATDCDVATGYAMNHRVLADVDDSGHPAYVFTTKCSRSGSAWNDNIIAYDHLGKVKWVSPPLSKPHPDNSRGAPVVPPGGLTPGGVAYDRGLSVARLTADGPPVLLMNVQIPHNDAYTYYYDTSNVGHYAGCRAVTGLPEDENIACRATLIISGTDGSILQALITRDPAASTGRYGGPNALWQMPPIAMDIDGDGRVDLVSGTDVWMQNAGGGFDLGWHLPNAVNDTAVADLDGDGKAEIIHLRSSGEPIAENRGIFIYSFDGHLRRHIPLETYWFTPLTIADVDGDGRSDIILGADGTVYAFRDDGQPIWAYSVPNDPPDNATLAPYYTNAVESLRVANAAPQVYDLDGDGVAEVVFSANSRIMILNGRTGLRKLDPYWTYSNTYADVSALMLLDMDNDGHVDIVQNSTFLFNCGFSGADFATECAKLVGPIVLSGGGSNHWLPGPKAFPHVQYRSTAIDNNARVLHDTKVSRIFRVPEQQGTVRDPRLAQATSFTYTAGDGTDTSASASVIIDIVPENQPPVFTSTPPKSLLQVIGPDGWPAPNFYDVAAYDPDPGDIITFSLKKVTSSGVTINSASGRIRFEASCAAGYPAFCNQGWTTVIVTATDSRGASTDQIFIVNLTSQSRTVPNVVGMSLDAAQTALIAQDLQGVKWVESFSAMPAGTVLAQDAIAGATVGRFDDIRLTVSKGPQPFTMPFVVGQQLAPTNALLTSAGLSVNVTSTFSTTIPVGEIMSQAPAAGTVLQPATALPVALMVSAGGPLPAPIASIVLEPGPGPLLRLAGDELQYKAVAILTDGTSADVTLSAAWSSSLTGVATISPAGFAKAINSGTTVFSASLGGKTGQGTLNVASRVLGDNTPPTAAITSPADGGAVTGPTPIVGTASDTNFLRYELAYAVAGDENYTLIAEGTTAVTGGTLGTLDPTMLVNDLYTLRLKVFDQSENESVATRTVQLTGNRKVGLFSLTFNDLTIPMSGIPITVNRTYDSRDKTKGDFGVGWRLGLQTLRLRTNRVLGTGWVRNVSGINVTLDATYEHKVSLTLVDGRVEEFDMIVWPRSNIGSLDFTNVTGFQPRSGTLGQLQALSNNSLLIVNGGSEVELVDDATLNTYSPTLYRYTAADGTQIEISPTAGVQKVTDLNGNTLRFGPGGIIHSAGKSVLFTRDPQGRITQITDPTGNVQNYTYDGNGDLVNHANAVGAVSRYAYNRSHGLIDIRDPAGNHPARNDYDDAGRLTATTDAAGNQITFTHNLGSSQEIVRDRLGNPTLFDYDALGNVLAKTDAMGKVTVSTYDGRNNRLTETDPLGRVSSRTYDSQNNVLTSTDFDGNTTTRTYNARRQVLTTTDQEGRTSTNVYDGSGNLTQETKPEGGVTRNTYNAAGNRLTTTDPLGNVATFTYDAFGNQPSITDPLGHIILLAYDANGHLLSGTDAAGKITKFTYDAAGRVTQTTDKLGQSTSTTYSAMGDGLKIATFTDANGGMTDKSYDSRGNETGLTFPDGSTEATTYDAEGRPVSRRNRDGQTTMFQYDALSRLTTTTNPDGTTIRRTYDDAGRVVTQTDERGNVTGYSHAPNKQTVTDASGKVTVHEFDSRRRQIKTTDALGHVTTFAYDSNGNLARTTFSDGTSKTTTYDAAGQKTTETDQAGHALQFAYDAAGRLIRATNAVGGITSYGYDTVGNRVTETDANGRVTQLQYDAGGRLTARIRPLGQRESFIHDANGNQLSHTDFNGQTTTFTYNAVNRQTASTFPGGAVVTYAYTGGGSRTQAGGDSYVYDVRGRLIRETKASGELLTYTYDAAGNKASFTTPQGTTVYTHDVLNRPATVVDATGTTTYAYDAVGNLAGTTYPNGNSSAYTFDALNRLTQVTNSGPSGLISSYTYALGAAGNRLQVVEAGPAATARTVSYSYDAVQRLTQEAIDEPGTANDQTIAYSYDAVGNRAQMNRAGIVTSYGYDFNDRLLTEASSAGTFTSNYDGNGNLRTRGNGSVTDTYVYDAENRLVSATVQSGINPGAVDYAYDADGMRTSKTVDGIATAFLLDKNRDFAQVVVETTGATATTYTLGRQLIGQTRTGAGTHFHLADGQLSTRQLTTTAGSTSDTYTYDAFGVLLNSTGTTANLYGYTGEQFDPNVGFYYLRARYYAPQQGRFITTDPELGDVSDPVSLHRYVYGDNDPVLKRDPSGREGEGLISVLATLAIDNILNIALFTGVANGAITLGLTGDPVQAAMDAVSGGVQAYFGLQVVGGVGAWLVKRAGQTIAEKAAEQSMLEAGRIAMRSLKVVSSELAGATVAPAFSKIVENRIQQILIAKMEESFLNKFVLCKAMEAVTDVTTTLGGAFFLYNSSSTGQSLNPLAYGRARVLMKEAVQIWCLK